MSPRAIVVGSGAGGATVARELQGAFDVTILEAGGVFRPLSFDLQTIERLKRSRLLFDPSLIRVPFPAMRARSTPQGLVLVNGVGIGGTTTIATGNGLRMDDDLRALGLDLDEEFDQIRHEIPVSTAHRRRWHATTRRLFGVFEDMGLDPEPMPKMGESEDCRHCGRCVLGCPEGVKWDARRFVDDAARLGARVITRSPVERIVVEGGAATGVIVRRGLRERYLPADLVVLAAGGLGTPSILERSGITCDPTLFVDPVLTVAGRRSRAWQCKEIEMPFVAQRDGFILSPYFDYLSFLLEPSWEAPARDLVGVMIKIADTSVGAVTTRGVEKGLTARDVARIEEGVETLRGDPAALRGRGRQDVQGDAQRRSPGWDRATDARPTSARCIRRACRRTCTWRMRRCSPRRSATRRSSRSWPWRSASRASAPNMWTPARSAITQG